MRVIFAGTPAFALPSLAALLAHDDVELVAVVTRPDRPHGRGRRARPSAVAEFAAAHGLPLHHATACSDDAVARLGRGRPDLMVVVAYGVLLARSVLAVPRRGCVNVHASLLPRWRGAAPVARAIEAGDSETGVTLMQMAPQLDAGAVLAAAALPIAADDSGGSLSAKLATAGGELLAAHLPALAAGALTEAPQDERRACYAAKLTKAEAPLDWRLDAATLARKVRAFNPWPMAVALRDGVALRVLRAVAVATPHRAAPGEILGADAHGITVATAAGRLTLTEVQKPGGRAMAAAAYLRGAALTPGMRFTAAP